MTETCPSCKGDRIPDDPDALAAYRHEARCALADAERQTLAADLARYRRFATHSRHRPATPAERALLAASGVPVPHGECFTRVQWQDDTRTRTWRRQPIVSVTAVSS